MTGTDPFELFKQLDPSRQLDPAEIEQRNADVLREILQQPRSIDSSRTSRRKPWLLGGGLVVAVLATAAFAVIRFATVSDPLSISCMATSEVDSEIVALRNADDPIAACGELWETGILGNGEIPELSGCVNGAGAATVFPSSSDICSRLGLAELEIGLTNEQRAITTLEDSLVTTFADDCFDQDSAVEEAQRQLNEAGLDGWTINVPEPFPNDAPCAVPGIDIETQQVVVIGARTR